ncbi:hypothetical protein EYC84_010145 [Monilinia fructicola]|uniref:Uncharacterized protein n=1 Tax=Monilinia fructicola TaxID=38448 RepID=A0A5M9JEJ4_MONFR|nr:hypothetical protein EYC84_010145 [Monilinia fructicola]
MWPLSDSYSVLVNVIVCILNYIPTALERYHAEESFQSLLIVPNLGQTNALVCGTPYPTLAKWDLIRPETPKNAELPYHSQIHRTTSCHLMQN